MSDLPGQLRDNWDRPRFLVFMIDEIGQATNGYYVLGDVRSCKDIEAMLQWSATPAKTGRPAGNN